MAKELREKSLLRKSKLLIPIELVGSEDASLFVSLFIYLRIWVLQKEFQISWLKTEEAL